MFALIRMVTLVLLAGLLLASPAQANHKGVGYWAMGTEQTGTALTDAEIQDYVDRGVSMVIFQTRHLYGLGGTASRFTGNLSDPAIQSDPAYNYQKWLLNQNVVQRLGARGIKLRLGFYGVNYNDPVNPFHPWADDAKWNAGALPRLREMGAACKALGCDGFAIDLEEYPATGGRLHSLGYTNALGSAGRATEETQVRARGKQVMEALVTGFGTGVKLTAYYVQLPGSQEELVRRGCHGQDSDYRNKIDAMFYRGVTDAAGWARFDQWDAWFYKGTSMCTAWRTDNIPSATSNDDWNAIVRDAVQRNDTFWRSNQGTLIADRIGYGPFAWIPDGPAGSCTTGTGQYDEAKPVSTVQAQLIAARDVGTTEHLGVFANHCAPNWSPGWDAYEPTMRKVVTHAGTPNPSPGH
jgi:hypothetical protein